MIKDDTMDEFRAIKSTDRYGPRYPLVNVDITKNGSNHQLHGKLAISMAQITSISMFNG